MNVVCCGNNRNKLEFLCGHSFCTITEKRQNCKGIYYYLLDLKLEEFLEWLDTKTYVEPIIFTNPEIWVNRKKVTMSIKYDFCYFHFFDINYPELKNQIKTNFII